MGNTGLCMKRFLDTYALVEWLRGRPGVDIADGDATSLLNLLVLHATVARSDGEGFADRAFHALKGLAIPIEEQDVLHASKLKRTRRGLSYVDALGYAMAMERGRIFVTGDKEFRDFEGVSFLS